MSIRKRLAMGAGTATLALALGVTVLSPVVAGAQESTTSTTTDEGAEEGTDRVDRLRDSLDDLVTAGTITSAQADAVAEHLAQFAFHRAHHLGGRGRLAVGLEVAAEVIGIDRSALIDALRDGQTIAEAAAANGVDAQAVIDALVDEHQQRLDEAAGSITADESAERAANALERITDLVNGEFRFRPLLGTRPVPDGSSTSTDGA